MVEHLQQSPEASDQPSFVQRYNRLHMPVFYSFNTLDDARLQNRINRLFMDTVSALQLNDLMQDAYVVYEEVDTRDKGGGMQARVRTLSLRDLQPLTKVTSVALNGMWHTTAEKTPLEPESITTIQGYHEGDDYLTDIIF